MRMASSSSDTIDSPKNQGRRRRNDPVQQQPWKMAKKKPDQAVDTDLRDNHCVWTGLWTILNCLSLVFVLLVQGSLLNYCIINYNEGSAEWYFLFFADFLMLVVFMFSITFAWRFYRRQRRQRNVFPNEVSLAHVAAGDHHHGPTSTVVLGEDHSHASQVTERVGAGIFRFSFPKPMGMLPLIYVCWIVYSFNLVVKLYMLYIMKIPDKMIINDFKDSKEFLLITLAASVAIFLFWVESHWFLGDAKQRKLSKAAVDDLIGHTTFEIFDSLIFLDLITPDDRSEMERDHRNISFPLQMTILFFASINFMLPTLGLYRLSRTHFGEKTNGMIKVINETTGKPSTRGLGISIIYHLLRLFAVNIPFLVIRVVVSQDPKKELSIFIVKNALGIWVSLRNLIPEIKQWIRIGNYKKMARSRGEGHLRVKMDAASFDPNKGWELPTLYHNETENLNRRQFSTESEDIIDEEEDPTQASGFSSTSSSGMKNNSQHHSQSLKEPKF